MYVCLRWGGGGACVGDYENKIVEKFSEYNFQEILNHKQMGQLDVFLKQS